MPSSAGSRGSTCIHSSLDAGDLARLRAFAEKEKSSVSWVIKLAVIEFLNRSSPAGSASVGNPMSSNETRQGMP